MAKRYSTYRSKARPWLTTEEVIKITGATRRTLLTLEENGICLPHNFPDRQGVLGWTFEQAQIIYRAQALRDQGTSFEEIARLAAEDGFAHASEVYTMEGERKRRRSRKRTLQASARRYEQEQAAEAGELYLRYIPQRWLVIACASEPMLAGCDRYISARTLLADLADHVGWCATAMGGTLLAPDASCKHGAAYAELAAQPLPEPIPGAAVDGGCLSGFGAPCAFEDAADCKLCPRFGMLVDGKNRLNWSQYCSDLGACEVPYSQDMGRVADWGPWSEFAAGRGGRTEPIELEHLVAARPTLMPLDVAMPPGITCAVLPAGVYLCIKTDAEDQEAALDKIRMFSKMAKQKALTPNVERGMCEELEGQLLRDGRFRKLVYGDESTSPLTGMTEIADAQWSGWTHAMEVSDVPKLTVLSQTGLFPDWNTSIVMADTMEHEPAYELQVLLDKDSLPKRLTDKKTRKRKSIFAFGARPGSVRAISNDKAKSRCRECGATFEYSVGDTTPTCTCCGAAKVIEHSKKKQVNASLVEAEQALMSKCFGDAVKLANLAIRRDDELATPHWMRLLARYGVHWSIDPSTGRRQARVEHPELGPVLEDEDCRQAISLAGDAAWPVYSRQAQALELSRRKELERREKGSGTVRTQ